MRSATSTSENEAYQGNFTHSLTVAGFANMELNFSENFSGELLAPMEGTAANPIPQINVTGTIEAYAMIKVGFLLALDVEGDMDGIIKGFGVDPSVPTIQFVVIDGSLGSSAQIWAKVVWLGRGGAGFRGHSQRDQPHRRFFRV